LILGKEQSTSHKVFCFRAAFPPTKKILEEISMSRKTAYGSVLPVLVCWASFIIPASAQHFQALTGTLVSVSAGRSEVFGLDSDAVVWRYAPSTKSFVKIENAILVDVAVGGGSDSQADAVWGLSANGGIFKFNFQTKVFDAIPGVLSQIAVGVGNQDKCHPYEVWGVNSAHAVFRYNNCSKEFVAVSGLLSQVATGGGDVWGLNGSNSANIFHFNFATQKFVSVQGVLTQIAVGVNDVWGTNSSHSVFRYNSATNTFNSLAASIAQVAAGGDGVWAVSTATTIGRFDPSAESFIGVQGNLKSIAVGSGAGVFGVNDSDAVFAFIRP
jgi:hypothetical protein